MYRCIALAASMIALVASQAGAADGDMKAGTFGTHFCGVPATFIVQPRRDSRWVFAGSIRFNNTGEVNDISISQYDDNSLSITRYVPGKNQVRQRVITDPPDIQGFAVVFHSETGRGCPGAFTNLQIPR